MIYHRVFILLTLVVGLFLCQEEFHCKPKPGCQIAKCEPSPPRWGSPSFDLKSNLDRREFPVTCAFRDSSSTLGNINDFRKELNELKKENEKLKSENAKRNEIFEKKLSEMKSETTEMNKTFGEKLSEYEARIYKKLKRLLNTEAEKRKLLLESIRNETEKNSIAVEENRILGNLLPSDCKHVVQDNANVWNGTGGVFDIFQEKLYEVYCDMATDGGGWTVFQRRMDGSTDFYRTWEEYANGFGRRSGEFWLGLENIHQLTQDGAYELRVDLTDWERNTAFAIYGTFSISGRSDNYRVKVGDYSGTAGDSMEHSNNREFSAKNRDLDGGDKVNCAEEYSGAWWYNHCTHSNLNGRYNGTVDKGVHWYHWKLRQSLKTSEMKFRKK